MSRSRTEINPERAERVKTLIERENITQQEFAERIYQSQQNVSRIINLKSALTEQTADAIIKAFPEYRKQWILGYDNFMLVDDVFNDFIQQQKESWNAARVMLDAAVKEVCRREGIKKKPIIIDNPVEYSFLEAQLTDFATSIVWNYIKHRKSSNLWNLLDQDI